MKRIRKIVEGDIKEPEEIPKDPEEEKPSDEADSPLDRAEASNKKKEELLEREEKLMARKEKLAAEEMVGGRASAGQVAEKETEDEKWAREAKVRYEGTGMDPTG